MRIETLAFAAVAAALALFSGCASQNATLAKISSPYNDYSTLKEGDILHLPTGRQFTEAELGNYLGAHRVVYVGESHDSVEDHTVQFKTLKALFERYPGKVALGLEMMRTDSQEGADRWSRGEMDEKEMVRLWVKNWGNTWVYYSEIMKYVRDNKIPLIALNRPRPSMSSHKMGGAGTKPAEAKPAEAKPAEAKPAQIAASEAPKAPEAPPEPEIDYSDPYYEQYISAFFAGHDGGPDIRQKFLKGQLLWDETMAQTGADYLLKPENADKKLIVFAGGNHVRHGFGIPRRLFRRVPSPYVILEPLVLHFPEEKADKLMDIEIPALPLPLADVIWAVGYSDLEDKIIRLGVAIRDAEGGGVLVSDVVPESSAEKAGVKSDDVLTALDGVPLKEMFDLTYELSKKAKDTKGTLELKRGEETLKLEVTYAPVQHNKK